MLGCFVYVVSKTIKALKEAEITYSYSSFYNLVHPYYYLSFFHIRELRDAISRSEHIDISFN